MPRSGETRSRIGGWPLAAAIAVVLVFLFFVRHILLPFILAAALAFVLTPVVDFLQRRSRLPRWVSALAIYVFVLVALAGLAYFVAGPLIRDVADLVGKFPQLLHSLVDALSQLSAKVIGRPIDSGAASVAILDEIRAFVGSSAALSIAGYGVASAFGGVLLLVLLLYFLVSGKAVAAGAFWLVPPEYRREVDAILQKVLPLLWRYFVGLLIVVSYTVSVAWIGFAAVFHLPRAPLLAVVVGLLELVPFIGPLASIAIVALTAAGQASLIAVLGLIVFAIAVRLSIDQLIGPLVLGQVVRLHPVVVIFSFLSGAVLFGITGLLLAVPVAASIKIILATYYAEPVAGRSPPPRRAR